MSSSHILLGLMLSVLLNAYLVGRLLREKRRHAHKHTWTPWTDWRELSRYTSAGVDRVWFQRRRYCSACASEERQNVGEHTCKRLWKSECPHREVFVGVFDPMYELKQINKDLEEFQ
jgi:hypothetical protein